MAKFFRRGKTQVWFVPTAGLTSATSPSAAEVNAGSQLTASVGDMAGWSFSNEPIDVPTLDSAWVSKIPGPDQAEESSITFYEDTSSNPLRSTLAKGTTGYIVIKSNGSGVTNLASTNKVDVFKVEVAGTPREYSLGNDPARWTAQFTITDPPNVDATAAA